ncbi:hypothetical protein AVEN_72180-1 [Araneus ventricosus]|uniref:Uncharacterized protein n=1 Tax=Araneus ventricosus TaxID=182803 RepID=A0A4Y2EJZ1_ARAVE|nr:hypothetical protein AVEN_72180-1 [Araneus ventricosus]
MLFFQPWSVNEDNIRDSIHSKNFHATHEGIGFSHERFGVHKRHTHPRFTVKYRVRRSPITPPGICHRLPKPCMQCNRLNARISSFLEFIRDEQAFSQSDANGKLLNLVSQLVIT